MVNRGLASEFDARELDHRVLYALQRRHHGALIFDCEKSRDRVVLSGFRRLWALISDFSSNNSDIFARKTIGNGLGSTFRVYRRIAVYEL